MSPEKEEVLTDPGNHAVLKLLAEAEEKTLQEAAEEAGMEEDRLREKSELLEEHGFLERTRSTEGIKLRLDRQELQDAKDDIKGFLEEHSSGMDVKTVEEKKALQQLRKELEEKKEETSVMKKEKKYEKRIEAVDEALEKLDSREDPLNQFEAFSRSHRIQRFLGDREENFHGFNPGRKVKAAKKIDDVLKREPEKDRLRRFFGNRWVTEKGLDG